MMQGAGGRRRFSALTGARSRGAVRRDGGIAVDPEAPGAVGGETEADAGAGARVIGWLSHRQGERAVRQVGAVVGQVDAEGLAEPGGTSRQVADRAAGSAPLRHVETLDDLACAHQDSGRTTL